MHSDYPIPTANVPLSADKPVLAILTVDDDVQLFRGNRHNFADLLQTGKEMGILAYVTTVKLLKLKSRRVLGFTYRPETEIWEQMWFPRPNVIYNRIPFREDERQPHVRRKLTLIAKKQNVQMFNRRFFNKWSLFRWLHHNPKTRKFVPDTRKLTGIDSLARQLKRHRLLYLKPVRGKAGVGIMTVRVQSEKQLPYRLQIQEDKGSKTYRCASLQRLWDRIASCSDPANEAYIAQQGITLASVNDRPFDLRALAQKNHQGKWTITGIGARVAGQSSITTHVPRGGNIDDPYRLLSAIFGKDQARAVMDNVNRTVLLLAKQIERGAGTKLGEMSMDLGVDRQGQIWFLEANSKPMKFDEADIRRQSLQRIFQYSVYLHQRYRGTQGG